MKFSIKDFFSKCEQIRSFLWIWSHLLKKSFKQNLIFCAVTLLWHHKFRKKILCKTKREKFLQEFLIFYLWQTIEPPDDHKVLFIFAVKSISWIICWIFSECESSSSKLYQEIVVLKTLTNFTGRHLWWRVFLIW